MEVLLRESVVKLGKRGDVVKVAHGYARNYLLPKRMAVAVTAGNKKQLEGEKRNYERKLMQAQDVAEEAKNKLDQLVLEIPKRASDNGHLFGSVTRAEISGLLQEKGFDVDRRKMEAEHIKELGEYPIKVRLHHEVYAEFKVVITQVD